MRNPDKKKANRTQIYDCLRKELVTYNQIINHQTTLNPITDREPFVRLPKNGSGVFGQHLYDIGQNINESLIVRKTVLTMLEQAVNYLQTEVSDKYQLVVSFGYRDLSIQTLNFQKQLEKVRADSSKLTPAECFELAHFAVAAPDVAGHPTGGAVDVTIFDQGKEQFLDFGTKIGDFNNADCLTNSPFVNKNEAGKNRQLLQKTMMRFGFAPFLGEWWHFSFGDREWSYFYRENQYFYNQIERQDIIFDD